MPRGPFEVLNDFSKQFTGKHTKPAPVEVLVGRIYRRMAGDRAPDTAPVSDHDGQDRTVPRHVAPRVPPRLRAVRPDGGDAAVLAAAEEARPALPSSERQKTPGPPTLSRWRCGGRTVYDDEIGEVDGIGNRIRLVIGFCVHDGFTVPTMHEP